MDNPFYFVRGDDGEEYGPVHLLELRDWVRENRAGLDTLVRPDQVNTAWRPWQEHPELVALLAQVRATRSSTLPPDLVGLEFAPLWSRAAAWLLDNLLLFFLLYILVLIFLPTQLLQQLSTDVFQPNFKVEDHPKLITLYFLYHLMQLLYLTACVARGGATPAKQGLQLRVVDARGRAPSFTRALIRTFLLLLSLYGAQALPIFYVFFNPQRRALHDLIAGTYVVRGKA